MKFPLSKEQEGYIETIKERFENCENEIRSITPSWQELQEWQDILSFMEERRLIRVIPWDGGKDYLLVGSFEIFEKEVAYANYEANKEQTIKLAGSIIGSLLSPLIGLFARLLGIFRGQ